MSTKMNIIKPIVWALVGVVVIEFLGGFAIEFMKQFKKSYKES